MVNPLKTLKNKVALRTRVRNVFSRKGSDLIVIDTLFSLIFFTLAFLVFLPLARRNSDWLRLLVVGYGLFVIIWCGAVVYDYLIKSSRLLQNQNLNNYSVLASLNTILGLAIPLFVMNSVGLSVIKILGDFTNFGTVICEIRLSVVRFYFNSRIYDQANSIIFWIFVFAFGMLVLGGLLERISKKS